MGPVTASAVIRALWDLHDRAGEWPTRAEVAAYLKASEDEVQPLLRELESQRLFRPRQRNGRRVWMSWR